MDFGLVLQTDPPALAGRRPDAARGAQRVQLRLDLRLAVLWQEPFVIYSADPGAHAAAGRRPDGDQPGHPGLEVTASTFATLNEMYGNRTVCGIGRGDSAMRVQGRKPNTLARLGGRWTSSASWPRGARRRRAAPRSGSRGCPRARSSRCGWPAYGPKALALAGQEADGFILQLADPYLTEWMVKAVRAAAEAAGRDPDELTICVAAPAYVGDDLAHAREQCRWFGGMVGNHVADLVTRYGETRRGAGRADRVHQGPRGLRLQPPRQGREPVDGLRARRGRRPVLPARPGRRRTSRSWRSCASWASTSSPSTPCTTRGKRRSTRTGGR